MEAEAIDITTLSDKELRLEAHLRLANRAGEFDFYFNDIVVEGMRRKVIRNQKAEQE